MVVKLLQPRHRAGRPRAGGDGGGPRGVLQPAGAGGGGRAARVCIYTLSTHYLHTIYTLSTHYLHTIYTVTSDLVEEGGPGAHDAGGQRGHQHQLVPVAPPPSVPDTDNKHADFQLHK